MRETVKLLAVSVYIFLSCVLRTWSILLVNTIINVWRVEKRDRPWLKKNNLTQKYSIKLDLLNDSKLHDGEMANDFIYYEIPFFYHLYNISYHTRSQRPYISVVF